MIWLKVNEKAKEIFHSGLFALYTLNENSTESLIETFEDLEFSLAYGVDIAIKVGLLKCCRCGKSDLIDQDCIICDSCMEDLIDDIYARGKLGI